MNGEQLGLIEIVCEALGSTLCVGNTTARQTTIVDDSKFVGTAQMNGTGEYKRIEVSFDENGVISEFIFSDPVTPLE